MTTIAVVFHSKTGRTRALAEAVAHGAAAVSGTVTHVLSVTEGEGTAARAAAFRAHLDVLAQADAIVFGCPTYMGSASAELKAFMDATVAVWALQGFRDKLAAGFTHSSAPSGDKLGTLTQLAVFAAQHGMIWVGLGLPPTYAAESASDRPRDRVNRLGSHLGLMAQSPPGAGARPDDADLETARHLGRRVAEQAAAFARGRRADVPPDRPSTHQKPTPPDRPSTHRKTTPGDRPSTRAKAAPKIARHPTTHAWSFPRVDRPEIPGIARTNLRELAARPDRLEHHLTVVAQIGDAQLEIATASEPLYFAHVNVSDEYVVALPTGDDLVDKFPLRTFLADLKTGVDTGRYNHRTGDLVLHPVGALHWPGKLRPPYEPFAIPKGMRRTGVSLIYCASDPAPADPKRTLVVSEGRSGDVKSYVADAPPMMLADLFREPAAELARVAGTRLELLVRPERVSFPHGAWIVVLEVDAESMHHACDLLRVPPGISLDTVGIVRALAFTSDTRDIDATPASWSELPALSFARFEDAARGTLPFAERGITIAAAGDDVRVSVSGAEALVPRYWLARMLYRIGAHGLQLGHVETYGGFVCEDRSDPVRIGLRGAPLVDVPRDEALAFIERMYRAVAPDGYVERLDA